jgi:hypothetical protein
VPRSLLIPALLISISASFGCSEVDQTYFVSYRVANESSVDVFVDWGSEYFYSLASPIYVPSGDTKEILYYEEFLGPTPDADAHFTCISARRVTDDVLVYQRTELENRVWRIRDLDEYHFEFTLEITNERLNLSGIKNRCGQLFGTVTDSLTMAPLDRVSVMFEDSLQKYVPMQGYSGGGDKYSLVWSSEVRRGYVRFDRVGYRRAYCGVPRDADSLGDRRYRLDVSLVPDSLQ